ncbi:MAG: N-acetylneuraminate synthase family protein [Candidatus Marisimplicoccus sp.]|tara:strand:- start:20533 stop:21561 length:1029 start_codon:yes stop_codon:yes gene_type:complete
MKIKNRNIGKDEHPLIIAEIGINHGGCLNTAKEMVDSAKRAGVEIIKHQTHIVEDEMSPVAKNVIPGNSNKSIYEIMEQCSLNFEEEFELKKYVEENDMIFISTPFSRAAVDRLVDLNVPAFKIGSGECNNYPLIEYICKFNKPIILSTGMNNMENVKKAVKIIRDHKLDFALLHTTNLYPTPFHLVRLGGMQELMNEFNDIPIGLSDHTLNNLSSYAAISLGASIIERHYTDNMNRKGPDIVCSMDEKSCRELIINSKIIKSMLGGKKEPAKEEEVTINFAFSTVVSIKDIKAGDTLSNDNIWVKRPGTGKIKAEHFNKILGKISNKNINKGEHLNWSDFE